MLELIDVFVCSHKLLAFSFSLALHRIRNGGGLRGFLSGLNLGLDIPSKAVLG